MTFRARLAELLVGYAERDALRDGTGKQSLLDVDATLKFARLAGITVRSTDEIGHLPIGRGLRGRCPRCGDGHLFKGFLSLRPKCEHCGLDYGFADSGDGPFASDDERSNAKTRWR